MITPTQMRAARAMLDVSQGHVAEYLGIAANTLSKIESGQSDVSGTRLTDIQRFYEREGVEFTENDGVKRNLNPIFFIETDTHEETYLKILEDVSEQLKGHKNPELLIMYSDDKVSSKKVNDKYRQMRNEGIKMRQLIEEGNTYMMGPLEEYRYIKKGFFINRVTLVYGDRIANETSNVLRASIRVDPINAEIQRNTFNMLWSILEQPVESTSNERF
ncbi:MAG: helix-turn-helix transcriptional regulator [Alphaproteobacteria bacterium]|nr:helix-turn-helix transcriptional regulator [Alphaproteobacteria bacterium]NCQ89198.1 helix-turn-helix transcriptional regulator [Alphaproteobacteria bacterium]NCT08126.1 helix-turn-helix transcriptional regulator [Alphaproteobacteria bacterium]